ncbi:hypothetical protein HRG_011551 [Hirsutella rhossiliensis]|uniref:Uncharacterized protein n=1 Tax=Hirsutella rhossiliensis TaxID=111463 RepID=A0A9P8MN17_9HYPO|nr:uncharacterized protein HRG_11551 [Hirsutella rhossiliensis]KAH0957404.1 hypothetical protein HRG_11551 [Hirsutella rhossiliensis]
MKTCLVTILTLCLAGSGLAAPTQAVSSQLSQRDVAALQDLVRRKADVSLSASETNSLLANLISDLGNGQTRTNGVYRRRPDANLVDAANASDCKSKNGGSDKAGSDKGDEDNRDNKGSNGDKGGKGGPLDDVTDAVEGLTGGNDDKGGKGGPLGGVTNAVEGLAGGKGGKGGPLGGVTDAVGGLTGGLTGGKGGPLGGVTDALGGLTGGLLGGGDKRKGGLLGGLLIPGLLKREIATEQQENSGMLQERAETDGLLDNLLGGQSGGPLDALLGGGDGPGGLLGGLLIPGILRRDMAAKQEMTAEQLRNMILERLTATRQGANGPRYKRDSTMVQEKTAEELRNMILERLAATRQSGNRLHEKRDSAMGQGMTAEQLRNMILERLAATRQSANGIHDKRDSTTIAPGEIEGLGGNIGSLVGNGVGALLDTVLGVLGLNGGPRIGDVEGVIGSFPEGYGNRLTGDLAGAVRGQRKSFKELTHGRFQGSEDGKSSEFVQSNLDHADAGSTASGAAGAVNSQNMALGAGAGKLSQASNSTFVATPSKKQ